MTPKEQKFCDEYLIDLNATQAAIRSGYSAKTANEAGARLLAKVSIQAKISKRRAELAQKTAINQEWVLNNFIELQKKAKEIGDFGASIKANELIGKHLGFFEKDNEQGKTLNLQIKGLLIEDK